ncbi:MAG: hypothetical protein ABH851_05940 [Methanobacteriota archaeon]
MTIKKFHRLEAEDPAVVQAIYGFIESDRQVEIPEDRLAPRLAAWTYTGIRLVKEEGRWLPSLTTASRRMIALGSEAESIEQIPEASRSSNQRIVHSAWSAIDGYMQSRREVLGQAAGLALSHSKIGLAAKAAVSLSESADVRIIKPGDLCRDWVDIVPAGGLQRTSNMPDGTFRYPPPHENPGQALKQALEEIRHSTAGKTQNQEFLEYSIGEAVESELQLEAVGSVAGFFGVKLPHAQGKELLEYVWGSRLDDMMYRGATPLTSAISRARETGRVCDLRRARKLLKREINDMLANDPEAAKKMLRDFQVADWRIGKDTKIEVEKEREFDEEGEPIEEGVAPLWVQASEARQRARQGGTIETIPDYVGMSVTPEHGVEWFTALAIEFERQMEGE